MLAPGLSMLWEQVDPVEALRSRFGFAGPGAVSSWLGEVLGEVWSITAADLGRVVISDRNAIVWVRTDRGRLVVKWSAAVDRFDHLSATAELLPALADRGVPVAVALPARDGRRRVELAGPGRALSLAVTPELPGSWLDVTDERAVRSAGARLAALHRALEGRPTGSWPTATRAVAGRRQILDWLERGDPGWAPRESEALRESLDGLPDPDDPPQLLHQDFRAANLLVQESVVTGVLDLDEVATGHRVADLALACVRLGTRFTGWRPTPVAAQRALHAGYESVRPLGELETRWLDVLVRWQAVLAVTGPDDPAGWATTRWDVTTG